LVDAARAVSPGIAITTDVIVGFPGETEADFAASLDFVTRVAFARLHVFPYSERPGTPAVRLPGAVPAAVRTERAARMRALGEQLAAEYRLGFVGQIMPVLWEQRDDAGYWRGLTDNYLEVATQSEGDLYNRITLVEVL
jgi:threonylcarbamoyladenosine tRNA methylthiotransferase MtaB